jgi:hypothetical protein
MERDHGRGTGIISRQLIDAVQLRKEKLQRQESESQVEMKLSEDFSAIYLFQSPQLYFRSAHPTSPLCLSSSPLSVSLPSHAMPCLRAVELAIVLNSLYLSLWLINFITVCARVNSSPTWQIVM